jgi:MFS family permease
LTGIEASRGATDLPIATAVRFGTVPRVDASPPSRRDTAAGAATADAVAGATAPTARWWVVLLLFTGSLINTIDRGSISTAVPSIMRDLHLDEAAMGIVLSSFFWAYVALNIPIGLLADRCGAKVTLGWSAFVWSIFSALTAVATRSWHLVLCRLGVGAGEAAIQPVNAKVVRAYFSTAERGTVVGIYLSAFRLGFAAAPVIMGYLITAYAWRGAFVITGAASLIWVLVWRLTFKEHRTAVSVNGPKTPWRKLLRHRTITGLVVCKFFQDYSYYLFVTWLPTYLVTERKLSLIKSGWYAAIPWVVACLFQPLVGWLSDLLIRRGITATGSRKGLVVAMNLFATVVVFTPYTASASVAVLLLTLSLAFESASSVLLWSICTEVAPDRAAASVGGILNCSGAVAGIIAPIVTGYLVRETGNFTLSLAIGGAMFVCASLSMLLIVGKVETIPLDDH